MAFEQILGPIIAAMDFILEPLKAFQPHVAITILSLVLTSIVLILGRIVTNKKIMSEIKAKTEDLRVKLAEAQKAGNKEITNQLLNEMMKANSQYMQHSFKMLIVSLIVVAVFLPWAGHTYASKAVAILPFSLPIIGSSLTWVYWYFLTSFAAGWIIRKLFGFE